MSNRKLPLRQCTGCGEMKDKRTMIRVIKTIHYILYHVYVIHLILS